MADILDGLEVEAYDRQYSDRVLLGRLVRYFSSQRGRLLAITGTVMISALTEALLPVTVSQGVNLLASKPDDRLIALLVVVYAIMACSSWAMNLIRRRASGRTIGDIVRKLREDAFAAAVSRDLSFYDAFPSGKIVSRISSDTHEFAQVIVLVLDMISKLFAMVFLLMLLLTIEWKMALLLMVLSPSVIGIAMLFRRIARRASQHASRVLANVNNIISESVSGISVAKNFRQEWRIYEQFEAVNAQAYQVYLRRGLVFAALFPILHVTVGTMMSLLVYLGAVNAATGLISFGAWYLFVQSIWYFTDPLTGIASFWSQLQAGLASAERVFALIDAPSAVIQKEQQPVDSLRGEIEFKRVKFRYNEQEIVLPGLDLHIKPGETLAFVGHTGAGKSSIAKLTARFYEFQGGDILIDGRDIRTLDLHQYRRHLGIVSQVPFLFAGTVAENIRYARPAATDAEIAETAQQIGGGEWVELLPDGLQTQVGERGSRLSMGQRQLVALTRVLVQRPSIFIFDEATASIDPFTEVQIQEALHLILARTTSILIAHRLSTVQSADRIIVLKKGAIIEEGNHLQLMGQGGHYAELYNTYFRHQSLDYVERAKSLLAQ